MDKGEYAGLDVWGSDCLDCGNATPESQVCDCCGSSDRTTPLYIAKGVTYAG